MARFAIKTAPQNTNWDDMRAVWHAADGIDLFESAWNFDHFYPIHGDPNGPCMEAWVTLSALARETERIRIGCMVNGMHYRHPAITANMAASLDIVSGGRLNLGLGAGWFELESEAYGIELGTVGERMDRFDEGGEVIVRLLSEEWTTFQGSFYRLQEARCEPKGPQRPHPPIAIGGQGERRTLRTVARRAHLWDAMQIEPSEWPRKKEVLEQHCAEVGRDSTEITCSAHLMWSPAEAPGEIAQRASKFFDAGLDLVVLGMRPPHDASKLEPLASALAELQ